MSTDGRPGPTPRWWVTIGLTFFVVLVPIRWLVAATVMPDDLDVGGVVGTAALTTVLWLALLAAYVRWKRRSTGSGHR